MVSGPFFPAKFNHLTKGLTLALKRFQPRFLRPGTHILESGKALLGAVLLTSKSAQASLSIHDSLTSTNLSGSATRRLLMTTRATASAVLEVVAGFATGIVVVLGGVDSTCTVFTTRRR